MRRFDRILIAMLTIGIWTVVVMEATSHKPAYAAQVQASQIQGLDRYVLKSVDDKCKVSGSNVTCW